MPENIFSGVFLITHVEYTRIIFFYQITNSLILRIINFLTLGEAGDEVKRKR
jgi:hypothetical protein